jgi:hypothetical protein
MGISMKLKQLFIDARRGEIARSILVDYYYKISGSIWSVKDLTVDELIEKIHQELDKVKE